jgi:transposase
MTHPFVAVGIDSSDDHHDVCLLAPGTEPEVRLRITHDLAGFQHLLDELARRWPGVEYRFALENPRNLLGRFLLLSGQALYALNPLAVASIRKGLAPSGAKSDALDARVLALLLQGRQEQLQPLQLNSPQASLVAGLVEQRRELVAEKTRLQNQLTATLKGFYPRFRELFADLDAPITRAALQAFPSPTALAQATREEWNALFAGARYPQPARIPRLLAQAQAPQVPLDPVTEQLGTRQVQRLGRLLEVVHEELQQLAAALEQAFAAHPDADFFRSLPGAGPVLAPSLLALFGDNRHRWQEWRQLAAQSGTAPITRSSGKQKTVQMRFHCDRDARSVLHLYAGCSRRRCEWAEAFYQQQRQAGKTHSGALRSLANKWLPIMFRMWQERTAYDEAAYLARHQRRQAPQPDPVLAVAG